VIDEAELEPEYRNPEIREYNSKLGLALPFSSLE
jgi:hypothetical protein